MTRTLQDLASEFDALDREASSIDGLDGSQTLARDMQLTRALLGEALMAYGEDDEFLFAEVSDVMTADSGLAARIEDLLGNIRMEIAALAA